MVLGNIVSPLRRFNMDAIGDLVGKPVTVEIYGSGFLVVAQGMLRIESDISAIVVGDTVITVDEPSFVWDDVDGFPCSHMRIDQETTLFITMNDELGSTARG
jgi:hypothetical protein